MLDFAHGLTRKRSRKGSYLDLEPGHTKAIDGAVNLPQEEQDAQSKGNEETAHSEALMSQKVEDKRNQ